MSETAKTETPWNGMLRAMERANQIIAVIDERTLLLDASSSASHMTWKGIGALYMQAGTELYKAGEFAIAYAAYLEKENSSKGK